MVLCLSVSSLTPLLLHLLLENCFSLSPHFRWESRYGCPLGHDNCDWWTGKIHHHSSCITLIGKLLKCPFVSLILRECLRCLLDQVLLLGNSGIVLAPMEWRRDRMWSSKHNNSKTVGIPKRNGAERLPWFCGEEWAAQGSGDGGRIVHPCMESCIPLTVYVCAQLGNSISPVLARRRNVLEEEKVKSNDHAYALGGQKPCLGLVSLESLQNKAGERFSIPMLGSRSQ